MKFEDLLSIIDGDTRITIQTGDNSEYRIELYGDNPLLKLFNNCPVNTIFSDGLFIDLSMIDEV